MTPSAEPAVEACRRDADTAGVVARPPLVFLGSILAGLGLHWVWPARLLPGGAHASWGGILMAGGVALFVLAVRELRAARTGVRTCQPTTALVERGPYRVTRNPIYLAFVLFQLGVTVWVNSAWILGALIPALGVVRYGVIAREEAYLERKFGEAYRRYRRSVRRWL